MIGRQVAFYEKRFNKVRAVRSFRIDLGCARNTAVDRHITDIVLVSLERCFRFKGERVEPFDRIQRFFDLRHGNAMIDEDVEPDVLHGVAKFIAQTSEGIRFTGQIRADVQSRDQVGRAVREIVHGKNYRLKNTQLKRNGFAGHKG